MKNFKKTIALVMCLILALGTFANAEEVVLISAPVVKDYEGHWAQATIQKWLDSGKVSGYPDGSYKPDSNVTRAEFVKMVNGIIDFNKKAAITYKDVPSTEWFYDYIGVAQEVGYISGYSSDKFGPNDYITREQAASILSRIQYLDNNEAAIDKFIDNLSISAWAKGSVGAASNAGFISGYTDKSFKPLNNLTRAEALTMIDNVLVNGKNYIVYNAGTTLKDTVIKGDLVIAKTVDEGNVYLTNLEVKGEIKVFGGGMNSIYFNNVKVAKIVVEKDKVRLVFDKGSNVEEIEVTQETVLQNIDGTIAKIEVTGDNKITLKGNFDEITITGNANVVLDGAVITNLVVKQPIVIQGTGTVKTLQAEADGIKFEADVKIEKTLIGTGVTVEPEKIVEEVGGGGGGGGFTPPANPNIQIIIKTADQTNGVPFNSKTYKGTEKFKEFLVQEVKSIFNNAKNSSAMDDYINKINDRIDSIFVGGLKLYGDEGWEKAIKYLDDTDVQDDVILLKDALLDGIEKSDVNDVFALYEKFGDGDQDKIVENLVALDGKTIEYGGGEVEYKLTYKSTTLTKASEIAEFILNEMLFSGNSVEEFFDTYGEVIFTATYGDKTNVITIKTVTLD